MINDHVRGAYSSIEAIKGNDNKSLSEEKLRLFYAIQTIDVA